MQFILLTPPNNRDSMKSLPSIYQKTELPSSLLMCSVTHTNTVLRQTFKSGSLVQKIRLYCISKYYDKFAFIWNPIEHNGK